MSKDSPTALPLINVGVKAKAQQLVLKLLDANDGIKDVKNALKAYKITSDTMIELKGQRKILNQAIKEEKEDIENEFMKDPAYNELREEKLDHEEEAAVAKQDLKTILIGEAQDDGGLVSYDLEIKGQKIKLQAQLSLSLFLNGAEAK